eukprot:gene18588-37581_t
MSKKEAKYKVIKTEVPIDNKPIFKKEKPEIIDLTEVKKLFKKPEFVQVKPLTSRENPVINKNIISIFETMGFPYRLQSDNEFATKNFIELMDKSDVKLSFSDPNEINKNSIVERFNRTIRDLLKKYRLIYKDYNWPKYIDDLVDIYNNTFHTTIGDTPSNIWNNLEYNQQTIIRKPVEYKIGDM